MAWGAVGRAALNYAKPLLKELGKTVVSEGVSQGIQALSGQSQPEPDSWLGDDKYFNPPKAQQTNLGQGVNRMVDPVSGAANRGIQGLSDAAVDQVLAMFQSPGAGQNFSTQQVEESRNENLGVAANKSREQLEYEDQLERNKAIFGDRLGRDRANFTADLGNRAANANTARSMAYDTTQNLNRMYATAGDRLNTANANTQQALNSAAATIAGLFR